MSNALSQQAIANQSQQLSKQLCQLLQQHPIQVGIFWLVKGELVFIIEQLISEKNSTEKHCSDKNSSDKLSNENQGDSYIANYDMYDDMYTIDRIHRDVWEALRAEEKLPEHITAEQDFGDYPRGRILFDPHTQSHCVYSAGWLVCHVPFQNLIKKHYCLINPRFVANEQYEVDKEDHLLQLGSFENQTVNKKFLFGVKANRTKVRDPARIKKTLSLMETLWQQSPDLRFNQLIYNLQSAYANAHDNYGRVEQTVTEAMTQTAFDFFYLEDDDFIAFLENEINQDK